MKRVIISMALLLTVGTAFAQQSAIKEANSAAKSGNFSKAEQLINQALTNPETMNLPETWNAAGLIQQMKGNKQMEQAVTRKTMDTMAVYNAALDMCKYFFKCDELAQKPDAKGKINNKYRKKNQGFMITERQNLANGGIYFYNLSFDDESQAAKALEFFDVYAKMYTSDMFADNATMKADTTAWQLAYYGCLSAQKAKNYDKIIELAPVAMKSGSVGSYAVSLLADAYKQKGDDTNFLNTVMDGMQKYPNNSMLFAYMIDYYSSKNNMGEAHKFADDMIAKDPSNYFYSYVKGYLFQNENKFEDALTWYKKSCEQNAEYPQSFSNTGLCYRLMAQDFSEKASVNVNDPQYAKDQATLKNFFKEALPYYEKARELAPNDKSLWLQGLYSIYYNLDMGDKFKEIEAMM